MASEKLRREDVTGDESNEIGVVPALKTHFESLAEKAKDSDSPGAVADSSEETAGLNVASRVRELGSGEKEREERERKGESGGEGGGEGRLSLEEISNFRQTAQQNSMEAIRAAEERYSKTKDCAEQKGAEKETVPSVAWRAKDAVVETGKSAVGYAGKVAVDVKDKAVVAGWGAAHYTAEKTVDATKAAANAAGGVVGYAGEKAVAAKDVVAQAGQRAAGYTGEKVAAAKDAVVFAEESAVEYAARKKAEAERELEARKSDQSKGEAGDKDTSEKAKSLVAQEVVQKPAETAQERPGAPDQETERSRQEGGEGAGGVFQAIGETIVDIALTTKNFVVGASDQTVGEPTESGHGRNPGK
ncbi:hypothetical protein U1Q18_024710 [Sarracenia purpurea var. burkii]